MGLTRALLNGALSPHENDKEPSPSAVPGAPPCSEGSCCSSCAASCGTGQRKPAGLLGKDHLHRIPPERAQKSRSGFRSKNEFFWLKFQSSFMFKNTWPVFRFCAFFPSTVLKWFFTYLLTATFAHFPFSLHGYKHLSFQRYSARNSPHTVTPPGCRTCPRCSQSPAWLQEPRADPVPCRMCVIFIVCHLISGYAFARLPHPMPLREANHHCNS